MSCNTNETGFNEEAALELSSEWKFSMSDEKAGEIQSKIEDFLEWFNGTARLYLLRCSRKNKKTFDYLLQTLKQDIGNTVISNSLRENSDVQISCKVCAEPAITLTLKHDKDFWEALQNHDHFEEQLAGPSPSYDNDSSSGESYAAEETNSGTSDDESDSISKSSGEYSDEKMMNLKDLLVDSEELEGGESSESSDGMEIESVLPKANESKSSGPPGLNDFKFNFSVKYDDIIEKTLYPSAMIKVARNRDHIEEYTVQKIGANRGVCLLCCCLIKAQGKSKMNVYIVKTHAWGRVHTKSTIDEICLTALRCYHDFWRSQETNIQAHQVHFIPGKTKPTSVICHLCALEMNYEAVLKHIRHHSMHKEKILAIYRSPGGKLNDVFLIELQLEVYGIATEKKVENIQKSVQPQAQKNEARQENGVNNNKKATASRPTCVITKSFCDPHDDCPVPNRYKLHKPLFAKDPVKDRVLCTACKMHVHKSPQNLIEHILTDLHKTTSRIAVIRCNFYCEICNLYLGTESRWAEHFSKAVKRHESMAPSRKNKVTEYECETCKTVIFGDELSISRHKTMRSEKKKGEIKLPVPVQKFFKSRVFIEGEGLKMNLEANKVLQQWVDKTKDCCEDIQEALCEAFPGCRAYPFGSRMSGLGNEQSDLDIFVDLGGMYLGIKAQDSQSQENFVKKTAKMLRNSKDNFTNIVQIPSARTPIVKVRHCYTNFDCDISFRHGLGVENTKFLRFCFDLQPITQPFILVLKKWSNYCKLNEHITNYALALMAIFFLQIGRYLIPVNVLRQHNSTPSLIIDGWETINYTVPLIRMRELTKLYPGTLVQLLREFFFFYSKFDYANHIICPLLGYVVTKSMFNDRPNGESLPPEMRTYVQKIQSENAEIFRALSPLCVQDPFDLSHNLTKACQSGTVNKLKTYCTLTYQHLDATK